jgi:hypothetical protein
MKSVNFKSPVSPFLEIFTMGIAGVYMKKLVALLVLVFLALFAKYKPAFTSNYCFHLQSNLGNFSHKK